MIKLSRCPNCSSRGQREVYNGPDETLARYKIIKRLRYVLCGECSLVFANPRMTEAELAAIYDVEYWKADQAYGMTGRTWRLKPAFVKDRLCVAAERHFFLETRGILRRFKRGSSALEIGSGVGFVLSLLKRSGWEVQGVEPTPLAEFAKRTGVPTERAFFTPGLFREIKFNLISLLQVFEHIEDPVSFLKMLKGSLAPGGLIWLEIPDVDCPRPSDLTNPHLYYYSANTITNILARAGLRVAHIETYHSRSGAFQMLHVFARVGKTSHKPRKDDFLSIRQNFTDSWSLHRRKQTVAKRAKAYDRAQLTSLEKL